MPIDYQNLIGFRKMLHAEPEVAGNERLTSEKVIQFLKECKPTELLIGLGGFGIIATWDSGKPGEDLLFRAELDALPIQEINDFEYRSRFKGVSHKCGHDGHSTILCGLAQFLSENPPSKGKVRLLFQPAEENGEGAKAMLADARFKTIQPDFVFALHNLPGYPLHEVVIKDDTFTASVNSVIIHLLGKTAHAAEPEHGINPALAVAEIIQQSLAIENNIPAKPDMRVITPVCIELGDKAYGISAGEAAIHLTLRCWNDENLRVLEKDIEQIALHIGRKYKLKIGFEYLQTFHANVNHPEATASVRASAKKIGLHITERPYPFKWGEDFGLFTAQFRGCMFGLGAGENLPALHNPDYDFPDSLIETGVKLFSGIINTKLDTK